MPLKTRPDLQTPDFDDTLASVAQLVLGVRQQEPGEALTLAQRAEVQARFDVEPVGQPQLRRTAVSASVLVSEAVAAGAITGAQRTAFLQTAKLLFDWLRDNQTSTDQ